MSVKGLLGGKKPHGSGTKVSGYVESPVDKKCGTCEYLEQEDLCNKEEVQKDKQIKMDKTSGLKIVDPDFGCCDYWSPSEEEIKEAKT